MMVPTPLHSAPPGKPGASFPHRSWAGQGGVAGRAGSNSRPSPGHGSIPKKTPQVGGEGEPVNLLNHVSSALRRGAERREAVAAGSILIRVCGLLLPVL